MGKGVCVYYKLTWITLYAGGTLEGFIFWAPNMICVLPIFDRPNKVQCSVGAYTAIVVGDGSPS